MFQPERRRPSIPPAAWRSGTSRASASPVASSPFRGGAGPCGRHDVDAGRRHRLLVAAAERMGDDDRAEAHELARRLFGVDRLAGCGRRPRGARQQPEAIEDDAVRRAAVRIERDRREVFGRPLLDRQREHGWRTPASDPARGGLRPNRHRAGEPLRRPQRIVEMIGVEEQNDRFLEARIGDLVAIEDRPPFGIGGHRSGPAILQRFAHRAPQRVEISTLARRDVHRAATHLDRRAPWSSRTPAHPRRRRRMPAAVRAGGSARTTSIAFNVTAGDRCLHRSRATMSLKNILDPAQQELVREERRILNDLRTSLVRFGASDENMAPLERSIEGLDELFLLVVVGEFNAGKSAFINALTGERRMEEGVTPTTAQVTPVRYEDINIVDTPGHQRGDPRARGDHGAVRAARRPGPVRDVGRSAVHRDGARLPRADPRLGQEGRRRHQQGGHSRRREGAGRGARLRRRQRAAAAWRDAGDLSRSARRRRSAPRPASRSCGRRADSRRSSATSAPRSTRPRGCGSSC